MKYLSETGLAHFWGKIKDYFSSNYKKLDGSNQYVTLTGGNGNETGYRLVLAKNIGASGVWDNCSMLLSVSSRNTGTGILNIQFRLTGSLDTFSHDTRFFGSTTSADLYNSDSLPWKQYYNSETGMYYLFWRHFDNSTCKVTVLQQRSLGTTLPTNGEWVGSTIDESIYGTEYPIKFNVADKATTATKADKITTARKVTVGGDFTGNFTFDGSADVSFNLWNGYVRSVTGNKNNFKYHRIAKIGPITTSYYDASEIILMDNGWDSGGYGIFKISLRTNSSTQTSVANIHWLVRQSISLSTLKVAYYNVFGNTYVDVFYVCPGTYNVPTFRNLGRANRSGPMSGGFQFVSSQEVNDTTAEDKLKSVEVYTSIEEAGQTLHGQAYTTIKDSVDAGNVNYASKAGTADIANGVSPENISSGYTKNRFYLNTHPENNGAVIPFLYNDLAFLKERDGSYEVYKTTDTDYTPETLTNKTTTTLNIDNAFDGSPSYVWFNSILTATTEKVVIDITFPSQINEASVFYIDFGSTSWRAKDIYYYSYNHLTGVYELHGSKTNNAIGQYQNYASYRIYNEDKTVYSYGRKKMRIVLTNFNSKDFRISQIGLINYSSAGLRRTYISRGIDDALFRSLTPAKNNTYNLGSSTLKWKEVHATSFKGNADTATYPKDNQLSNVDLNSYTTTGFYYGIGNNGCTNKPEGANSFSLLVYRCANGYRAQEAMCIINNIPKKFIRWYDGVTWYDWTEMKYTDTTYSDATTEASGLMSSTDKTKLDGLQNYSNATTSAAGLMSAADKYKLDSMSSGGALNPDRVSNISYNSSTQKLTVTRIVNGQTVTPPDTLNIHEGHSNFKRTVLYDVAAGTNGNVTLSEQKDNFDELVIVYGFANNESYIIYKTETMPVVDGKQGFQLEYKYWTAVGKEAVAHVVYITENGSTTLVAGHKDKYVLTTSGDVQASSSSLGYIKIYKVYGIKYV